MGLTQAFTQKKKKKLATNGVLESSENGEEKVCISCALSRSVLSVLWFPYSPFLRP